MIEQALRTFLLSKTAITALVGTKIQVGDFVPLQPEDMPMLAIVPDAAASQICLDGTLCSLQFPTFSLKAKCSTWSDSIGLIDLVRQAFLGVPLGMSVATSVGGAPVTVTIVQTDILSEPFNEDEEDYGRGYTVKPRTMKVRIGWREPVITI